MHDKELLEDDVFDEDVMTEEELLEETIFDEPGIPIHDYIAQLKKYFESIDENTEKGKDMS